MKLKITETDALIVVDVQNDFMPWGTLPVPGADLIIPVVNDYLENFKKVGAPVFATRDWHPENHISFKENGGLWPRHCVQWSKGSQFPESLKLPKDSFIINKGYRPELEAYSAFQGTVLNDLLKERGVKRVFICGVATDYCVFNTALGAINLGYFVFVLEDGVKGVSEESSRKALDKLLKRGAVLVKKGDLLGSCLS